MRGFCSAPGTGQEGQTQVTPEPVLPLEFRWELPAGLDLAGQCWTGNSPPASQEGTLTFAKSVLPVPKGRALGEPGASWRISGMNP